MSLMLLSSSPPPSTLSAFVGLLKFVVGRLLSYWDPRNINKNVYVFNSSYRQSLRTAAIVNDRFEVGRLTEIRSSPGSYKHKLITPDVVGQKRFLLGTDLKNVSTTTRLMVLMNSDDITQFVIVITTTASSNKTPDVDSQSILPASTVSYTVHVLRRAEEVDEAMPSFENEEKRHVSDCFKSIKPSSPLSLCVNEITIFVCFFLLSTLVVFNYLQTISHQEKSYLLHDIDVKQCNKETN
ncbi:hypothetical protein HID58_052675 [Brassica napus]|uniref:DUF223 domain-containing protein n=1 Tax=Brassica napus TaxID=3708 RepID=A0ABQ8ACJ5_BRANA|nr:hypothetical protein HID58_052675 [Brassica napus]